MPACDFSSAFFHFRIDLKKQSAVTITVKQPFSLNCVRIPLESRCVIRDSARGHETQYVLGASCKTELVNVRRDLWMLPNADFCPVVGGGDFLLLKRFAQCDMTVARESIQMAPALDRQVGRADEAWAEHRVDVPMAEARALEEPAQVFEAVMSNRPLVSRTEFDLGDGQQVMLEYPVKTLNVSDRDGYYQVDTGPVLFPDLSIGHEHFIGNFRLAYVAHNGPDWAEFIVNVPTPAGESIQVHHYSKPVGMAVRNSMFEIIS